VAWFSRVDRQNHPHGLQLYFKAPPHAPNIRKYPASPGIRLKSPSVVPLIVRPLPGCRNNPSNLGCKAKIAFRSRGFSPPQRFAPLNQVRVYCNPSRPWGSLRFQIPSTWTSQVLRNFPRNASTPRRIPLVSSSTASLRPFPSCCYYTTSRSTLPTKHSEEPWPGRKSSGKTASRDTFLFPEQVPKQSLMRTLSRFDKTCLT
jgi:hypothetical protein